MKFKNIGKFQEGGAMPPQDPAALSNQDPMVILVEGANQALQAQDCQIAMQVCQMILELSGGQAAPAEAAPAPAPAEAQGEPVYRVGGVLVKRIKK